MTMLARGATVKTCVSVERLALETLLTENVMSPQQVTSHRGV